MPPFDTLPPRAGAKPLTTNFPPHEQLDQTSPIALQERLWQRMQSLPGVVAEPSAIAPAGSRAVSLSAAGGSHDAFMVGHEFAHLHPAYDGSLHLTLNHADAERALAAGWAEPHPVAPVGTQGRVVMVYGPRNETELAIVWHLVQRSHRFACGAPTPAQSG